VVIVVVVVVVAVVVVVVVVVVEAVVPVVPAVKDGRRATVIFGGDVNKTAADGDADGVAAEQDVMCVGLLWKQNKDPEPCFW